MRSRLALLISLLVPLLLQLLGLQPAGATTGVPRAAEANGSWPLDPQPEIVHDFAPPDVRWGSGHRGVDLAGHVGQPVRAALGGTVSFTGRIAGVAVVVVDHGATRTTYQPVAASVPRGTTVAAGAVIGRLQWFGTHCVPQACLHWGWIRGSTYLDPLLLVGGGPGPVRLLPLDAPLPNPFATPLLTVLSTPLPQPMALQGIPAA